MDDLKYWVAFNRIPGIGTVRFRALEQAFATLDAAWKASASELRGVLDQRTVTTIVTRRPTIDPDQEMENLERAGVTALTGHSPEYPPRLKEIHDPPPVLYLKGTLLPQDERSVAVVGTRKASAYGREVASLLAGDLARHQVTVVSGLARGIDAIAHQAALDAGGRTIAVLGNGLDMVYPPEHRDLAQRILAAGSAVVSEFPLGTPPEGRNFPRRNRIISGMTLGTLVVEAGEQSGAQWTVEHALQQGREVFAVPGSIFSPGSQLTNHLIKDGAKLVVGYQDILEELNLTAVAKQMEFQPLLASSTLEDQILSYLTLEPAHIDEVSRASGLPIPTVSGTLAMMELQGLVRQTGGMHYVRTRETVAGYGR
jgi:DNA processing protein